MNGKEAARRSSGYAAPEKRPSGDMDIVTDSYERAAMLGGIALGTSFGAMLALGVVMGW